MDFENENIGNLVLGPQKHAAELAERAAKAEAQYQDVLKDRPHYYLFEAKGRTWMVSQKDGGKVEIQEPKQKLFKFPFLAGINGFAQTVKRFFDPCKTVITVGRRGIVAETVLSAENDKLEEAPVLRVPYFWDDHAQANEMSVEQLYTWLDRYSGKIGQTKIDADEEKAIWMSIRSLRAVKADTYEVDDHGGSVTVKAKTEAGITGESPIPKFIRVEHRTGVSEFKTVCLYRLRANVAKGDKANLSFTLTQMTEADGSIQKFTLWAIEQLQLLMNTDPDVAAQPANWIISEGCNRE